MFGCHDLIHHFIIPTGVPTMIKSVQFTTNTSTRRNGRDDDEMKIVLLSFISYGLGLSLCKL